MNRDFAGNGFNTIFRPNNPNSPPLPIPFPNSDNVLELNLTAETLSFSKSLGDVPNRGTVPQNDIHLNGIPYVQQINDITIRGESTPIHFEPGLWMHVPTTQVPNAQETVTRMASIPHGTTIDAQGLVTTSAAGPPTIKAGRHHADRHCDGSTGESEIPQPDRRQQQHAPHPAKPHALQHTHHTSDAGRPQQSSAESDQPAEDSDHHHSFHIH
ncbi:MAG: hypothetical protein WA804_07715 [Terriglobales bacterium]